MSKSLAYPKTEEEKAKRKIKTYKAEYWTVNSILGNDWAWRYYLLGGREAGKSYAVMRWCVLNKLRHPDDFKFYWFRLTEASQKKLLSGNAKDFIDPDLRRIFKVNLFSEGNTVYTYKEKKRITKSGKEVIEKEDIKEFCRVMACSTFYNDKGIGYFDNQYKGKYLCVLDEMNREQSERNTFDIVYNFSNQIENVMRSTKLKNIKLFMIGNTLEEASDLLSNLNFIPDGFGRYKLKRKGAVVDYIKPSEKYLARRKEAAANQLMGNASTFTNEIDIDRSLIVNNRLKVSPKYIIKFTKDKATWFTVYNNNIISQWNNECSIFNIAMTRYLDDKYESELAKNVFKQFDSRSFKFTNLATFKRFQKQLKLLKKK
jgi:hypothetical protein